jgi:sugar phosphate isomerase/epimerase
MQTSKAGAKRVPRQFSEACKRKELDIAVALPPRLVQRNMAFLQRHGLGVEVMLYDTNWVCNWPKEKVADLGKILRDLDVKVSAHGPVHDLNPGSLDVVIRDYTQHCFFKTLSVCQAVGAKYLVLHLGINPLLPDSALDKWLTDSLLTWRPIVELAEQLGITILLENMFLPSPKFLVALKEGLASERVKFCFDIGHFQVYTGIPLEEWLDRLGRDIVELHLNDNSGADDEHLALGAGMIDFSAAFSQLASRNILPRFVLEMTSKKFVRSLSYLTANDLLSPFRRR